MQVSTFVGQAQIEESQAFEDYQEMLAYRESLGDFDREYPFDDSQADEKHPGFTQVFGGNKVGGFTDVELFRMFDIVGNEKVKTDNGLMMDVERPLFKITKINKVAKREIAKIEKNERLARIAKYAEHYANPANEGITPIDSIFEAVEDGRDFQVTPVMLAMIAAQDAADEDEE